MKLERGSEKIAFNNSNTIELGHPRKPRYDVAMQNKNSILRLGKAIAFTKFQSEWDFDFTNLAVWQFDEWEDIWRYMVLKLYFSRRHGAAKDQIKYRELKHIELICYYDANYSFSSKNFKTYELALDYTLERKEGYNDY